LADHFLRETYCRIFSSYLSIAVQNHIRSIFAKLLALHQKEMLSVDPDLICSQEIPGPSFDLIICRINRQESSGCCRMEEPGQIVAWLDNYFERKDLAGRKIMITAGPTYEKIDPVRFIGNYSSGKMGFSLAEECARRGAEVTLIAGPVSCQLSAASSQQIHRINVESCEEMYQAATRHFPEQDAAILCAAVADFRPETVAEQKIKRAGDDLVLRLKPTHDIAAALGQQKRDGQVLVGFALETNDEEQNAHKKLEKKNLDFIVLNSLRNEGTCFRSDENQISIISRQGQHDYERKSKQEVAQDIIDVLETTLRNL
jgi:phosphopantothenoylcysteine decarboxylase/phosphopantothenate--cysteine ligase